MAMVEIANADIVFGTNSSAALAMVDQGATRDDILAATGCVLGAAGINLSVARGEICVLMGLSGSGKSTVLRAVNRLNKVARGAVWVEHAGQRVDVTCCPGPLLREIRMHTVSMVFQQFGLLPWRTVRENVGFGLELRGMDRPERERVVDEKLAMVGLTAWAGKYGHELSGGMQQRVGLARAFATDADILLMDEPFSALDPLIRAKLQDELLDLQARLKKTILFVSHDLDEAMKLGSRIAILEGGRVVQVGTPEDIMLRPADAYVGEFVRHVNPLSVLRGRAVMRPVRADESRAIALDDDGAASLALDEAGRPSRFLVDGTEAPMLRCAPGAKRLEATTLLLVSCDVTLQAAIALKRQTRHPVILVDDAGCVAGICGDDEIYRALLRDQKTSSS